MSKKGRGGYDLNKLYPYPLRPLAPLSFQTRSLAPPARVKFARPFNYNQYLYEVRKGHARRRREYVRDRAQRMATARNIARRRQMFMKYRKNPTFYH